MNFYDFEHPFDDDFDDLSDYGDGTLAALSGASVWGGEGSLGPPSYSQSVGASLWSSSALVPTIDTLEPADVRLAGEVMSLPGRLARRQQLAALSRAYELRDTFMADPLPGAASPVPTPPLRVGGAEVYVLPAEEPRRVAEEVAAVEHMLNTAAVWLASVDTSSVPLGAQDRLATLAGQALGAVFRFPVAQQAIGDLLHPSSAAGGSDQVYSEGEGPSVPSSPTGGSSNTPAPRRPRRARRA
jgi:hypothetical protein